QRAARGERQQRYEKRSRTRSRGGGDGEPLPDPLQLEPLPLHRMKTSPLCSRRHFLQANSFGLSTLALAALLKKENLLASPVMPALPGEVQYDLTVKEPHFRPQAKAMISLFMMGGPSQMDLFDPKPMLNEYDGKNFPGEIKYDNLAQASSKVFGSPWKFSKHGE